MGSKEFKIAAVLGLLLNLFGCATINYTYRGKPCQVISEDNEGVVLLCVNPVVEENK